MEAIEISRARIFGAWALVTLSQALHNLSLRLNPIIYESPKATLLGGDSVTNHLRESKSYLHEMRQQSEPNSTQEYLSYACEEGLRALGDGTYGIGACVVYRVNGIEYVLGGRNRMRTLANTHYHAEEDAIDVLEDISNFHKHIAHARPSEEKMMKNITRRRLRDSIIMVRPAPHHFEEKIMITSLESCPGCMRRAISHRFDTYIVGADDPPSGSMFEGRLGRLPAIWPNIFLAQKANLVLADYSGDPLKERIAVHNKKGELIYEYDLNTAVDSKFEQVIRGTFDLNRELIDEVLAEVGLSDTTNFPDNIDMIISERMSSGGVYIAPRYKT